MEKNYYYLHRIDTREVTDADKERDDMIPGIIGIDIISTPAVLSLKFVDQPVIM